ncbi:MAG: isoprenylcysteine carboxylmethyltransferase family protein [Myxococcota bacterium]
MTCALLGYALGLGVIGVVNGWRVRHSGAKPFPFLRSDPGTAHGFIEKVLVAEFAVIGLYLLLSPLPDRRVVGSSWPDLAALVLLGTSFLLVAASILWMGPSWRIGIDQEPQAIVMSGPYRFIRHPIYTGMLLGVTAVWLALPNLVVSAWAAVAWVVVQIQARLEEEFLTANAPGYGDYAKRAGRFVPKIRS